MTSAVNPTANASAKQRAIQMQQRSMSRLAAVQALFQMEHSGAGVEGVVREFSDHRLGSELEGEAIRDADTEFFADIVRGVVDIQVKIDPFIERKLSKGWTLKRLDATARAILRCGVYELIRRVDVPYRVVIDEYISLANDFFEEGTSEPAFVNAVLDAAAHDTRPDEV